MKAMRCDLLNEFLRELEQTRVKGCEMRVKIGDETVFEYTKPEKPLYLAYSLTKPVTCVLALKLLERGKIGLDDRLSDYIPEFKNPKVAETLSTGEKRVRSAKREIELRDLFTMTAGFSYDLSALRDDSTLNVAKTLAQRPLLFDPGEHWEYGLSHDVLGAVIEAVSGERLAELMRKELFIPLNMTRTRFLSQGEQGIAPLYSAKTFERLPLDRRFAPGNRYDSGGAGLVTSLEDYSEFCAALVGGRIISSCTLELMTRDFLTDKTRPDFNWPQTRGYGYGLGVRTLVDVTKAGSLSPVGEFGWGGISGAYSLMDRSRRLSAVFMTHTLGADEKYLFPRLRNVLYAGL